jgi:nitrogen fixation protein NifU and related proteins
MTEMIKGKTLEEAKNFDWQKIVEELGGLPQTKVHCSVLAVDGLKMLISNYESKKKKK